MSSTAAHLTAPARTIQSFRRLSLCRSFAQKNAERKDAIWFRGSLRKSTACRGLPALPWRVCLPWPVGRVTPCAPPRQLHMLVLYDRRSCATVNPHRSEERRVGKECRSRWGPEHEKEKSRSARTPRQNAISCA